MNQKSVLILIPSSNLSVVFPSWRSHRHTLVDTEVLMDVWRAIWSNYLSTFCFWKSLPFEVWGLDQTVCLSVLYYISTEWSTCHDNVSHDFCRIASSRVSPPSWPHCLVWFMDGWTHDWVCDRQVDSKTDVQSYCGQDVLGCFREAVHHKLSGASWVCSLKTSPVLFLQTVWRSQPFQPHKQSP